MHQVLECGPSYPRIFMLNKYFLLSLFLLSLTFLSQPENISSGRAPLPSNLEASELDPKAKILSEYLEKHDSPLKNHAQDFIDASKTYDVDWKLVPAISGVESTFGKNTGWSKNAWGWGIYGNQGIGFNTWRDGIFTVTQGLKENYLNKGLTDPYSMNKVYAASPTWGSRVNYFMKDIDKFAKNHPNSEEFLVSQNATKTYASSARLAFKEPFSVPGINDQAH